MAETPETPTPSLDRFVRKVRLPDDAPPWSVWWSCWQWTAGTNGKGYGAFTVDDREVGSHRYIYMVVHGPIPDGLVIDHLCRTTLCVNPLHLEAVTNRTNVLRGVGPSAEAARRTECVNGHPFDDENTYVESGGVRSCRICRRRHHRIDGVMRTAAKEWILSNRPDVTIPSGQKSAKKWLRANEPEAYNALRAEIASTVDGAA